MHELSHTFGGQDPEGPGPDPPYNCVMDASWNHPLYSSGWFVHLSGNVAEMTAIFRG
ncbi:MAG: hypothetical protein ACFE95_13100 [Candidatus Hodarchaeota archaeon]